MKGIIFNSISNLNADILYEMVLNWSRNKKCESSKPTIIL